MKFLQRLSAAALFGTLMSSSGLAYALSLGWPAEHCLAFVFQMVVVPLFANAYLRTLPGSQHRARRVSMVFSCRPYHFMILWSKKLQAKDNVVTFFE